MGATAAEGPPVRSWRFRLEPDADPDARRAALEAQLTDLTESVRAGLAYINAGLDALDDGEAPPPRGGAGG